jgi:NADH-quinone oxidoreductase subunit N
MYRVSHEGKYCTKFLNPDTKLADVYQGSPTSVTLFISTVPKIAAVAMLVRLLVDGLGAMQPYWSDLFMVLAILSIAIGSIVALMQTNIKRLLAYSTISHVGFVLRCWLFSG